MEQLEIFIIWEKFLNEMSAKKVLQEESLILLHYCTITIRNKL